MSEPRPPVLLVEDDLGIRQFVRTALSSIGLAVHEAESLAEARLALARQMPKLIVLDLGLPDGDGSTLIAEVRRSSQVAILILSARSSEADKVKALDAGADDYVEKPFGVSEFLARVRANMRRRADEPAKEPVVTIGDVRIDRPSRRVSKAGRDVHLTPTEFKLLEVLIASAGRVMTHRHLLREVWDAEHVDNHEYLRVFMRTLRNKLEDDPAQPKMILTETGVGYRIVIA